MMRFICAIFGHKLIYDMTIASDPAFGKIDRHVCRCGKVTIT
jgi:hypothetical protein